MQMYMVQVLNLSPSATEENVRDFFSFSGAVLTVELERTGDDAQVAFVGFAEPQAARTAALLNGAILLDQRITILRWGNDDDDDSLNFWNNPGEQHDYSEEQHDDPETVYASQFRQRAPPAGVTVARAQEVVCAMLAQGYTLGKDALQRAKAFDEAYGLSANAAAKVYCIGEKIGINDKIIAGAEAVKAIDERYHVKEKTKSALTMAERTVSGAGTAVVNSSYFSAGALWLSGVLSKASQVAANLGNRRNM